MDFVTMFKFFLFFGHSIDGGAVGAAGVEHPERCMAAFHTAVLPGDIRIVQSNITIVTTSDDLHGLGKCVDLSAIRSRSDKQMCFQAVQPFRRATGLSVNIPYVSFLACPVAIY